MERLTKYIDGFAHGKSGRTVEKAIASKHYCRGEFEATGCVDRLALYEDTGLEPEEIPRWIPVSENDKKPDDTVIGCDKWGNVEPVLYIPPLKKWKIMPNACIEMDVIYGQSKPQPPKGEKPC